MISTRLIALLALAASLPLSKSEMLDATVRWDASNPPSQVTNPTGRIYLVQNGMIQLQDELAWNFKLQDGEVRFVVPDVLSGEYQVVLFGDSGNFSPVFTIIHQ